MSGRWNSWEGGKLIPGKRRKKEHHKETYVRVYMSYTHFAGELKSSWKWVHVIRGFIYGGTHFAIFCFAKEQSWEVSTLLGNALIEFWWQWWFGPLIESIANNGLWMLWMALKSFIRVRKILFYLEGGVFINNNRALFLARHMTVPFSACRELFFYLKSV